MFDDEIIKQAAAKYAEAIIDSMPEPSACIHDYSEEFEQRIHQIMLTLPAEDSLIPEQP